MPNSQNTAKLFSQETFGAVETGLCVFSGGFITDHGEINASQTQVIDHFNRNNGDKPDTRIIESTRQDG